MTRDEIKSEIIKFFKEGKGLEKVKSQIKSKSYDKENEELKIELKNGDIFIIEGLTSEKIEKFKEWWKNNIKE